jgi:hypothetical protein
VASPSHRPPRVGPPRARQDYRDAEVSTRLPSRPPSLLLQATIEGAHSLLRAPWLSILKSVRQRSSDTIEAPSHVHAVAGS